MLLLSSKQNILTSNWLITILPSMRISVADSALSGTHLLSLQSDYPPHKSISSALHIQSKHFPAIASEESSEKMEGLVSFQPFPSSVIQRRLSTVYLHRLTRSSSCAPLRAQQVSFSSNFTSFCYLLNIENVIVEGPL